jgi:hypothetical protein
MKSIITLLLAWGVCEVKRLAAIMSNYDDIKAECYEANLLLPEYKLVGLTFGNVRLVAEPRFAKVKSVSLRRFLSQPVRRFRKVG